MTHPTQPTNPHTAPRALAPWYITGTLAPDEAREVAAALACDPTAEADVAAWRAVRAAVAVQPAAVPSPAVLAGALARVRAGERSNAARSAPIGRGWSRAWTWAAGAVVAVTVMAVLWTAMRPGTVLEWTVQGTASTAFRVYRAAAGTAEFALVDEVSAQPGVTVYTFVDGRVWPGAFVYRVEAVGGEAAVSLAATETEADVGLAVLWEWLAIVVAGACMAYVVATLLANGPPRRVARAV